MKYKDGNLQHNIDRIKIFLFMNVKNVTEFFCRNTIMHVHNLFDYIFLL